MSILNNLPFADNDVYHFDDFFIESWFNYELYQAIYKYKQTSVASKEWETLDSES